MAVVGDVCDEDDVVRYIGEVLDAWGRIDILINNAALLGGRGVLEESLEFWNRAIAVAGAGTFLNTKHVAISMIEREIKGSIVNILSSNAWQGCAGVIAYAFHKGGLANFTRAAAMDLAPYGIRVNSYSPTAPRPDNPELLAELQRDRRIAQAFSAAAGSAVVVASTPARSTCAATCRWSRRRRPTSATAWRGCARTTRG